MLLFPIIVIVIVFAFHPLTPSDVNQGGETPAPTVVPVETMEIDPINFHLFTLYLSQPPEQYCP